MDLSAGIHMALQVSIKAKLLVWAKELNTLSNVDPSKASEIFLCTFCILIIDANIFSDAYQAKQMSVDIHNNDKGQFTILATLMMITFC